jgi:hypothetical protein
MNGPFTSSDRTMTGRRTRTCSSRSELSEANA